MVLNHLNLTVARPAETAAFLTKYFGMQYLTPKPPSDNAVMAFVTDENGMILSLYGGSKGEIRYPESFHIGFGQPTPERVDEINQRLKEDGYDVPPPSRQHGSWTFYFTAPGGFTIEVLC